MWLLIVLWSINLIIKLNTTGAYHKIGKEERRKKELNDIHLTK